MYVATNLIVNMIHNSKPTRAEVHDILETLNKGIDGLVLAAENAIGRYPIECVRIVSPIINEVDNDFEKTKIDYLNSLPSDRMIEPHGGVLVQQHWWNFDSDSLPELPVLEVDGRTLSDIIQITDGVYSHPRVLFL